MRAPSLLTRLFPHLAGLHLDGLIVGDDRITFALHTTRPSARCPACGHRSARVHSTYTRRLADLPCQGRLVSLRLRARRFRCDHPACARRTFRERLPALAPAYARRTPQLRLALERVGMALGGRPGARLVAALGWMGGGTSRSSLLRLVRAAPLPPRATPRALGVDDWALRKGHSYGTVLVDLDRHRAVDVLPERSGESFAAWLRGRPGVEVISRDRAGVYADGARQGAPGALQVADRFHLMKNLADALEQVLLRKAACLQQAAAAAEASAASGPAPSATGPPAAEVAPRRSRPRRREHRLEEASLRRHARRVAAYDAVRALHAKGMDLAEVARVVGVSRRTAYRALRLGGPPERKRPRTRARLLAPWEPYLLQRWQEGCHNGARLWRELRDQGFAGSVSNVARFVARLRRDGPDSRPRPGRSALTGARGPSARAVALLVLRRPAERTVEQVAYAEAACRLDGEVATAAALAEAFARMLRERQGQRLDAWIAQATGSGIDALRRFALGLQADHAAVEAGLTSPYSNGQVEGQVNRLKTVKRQMYGRAGVDLLRQRVLHAA